MPRRKKSWAEKMDARPPHTARLETDFAGIAAGSRILISSPREIAAFLSALPSGKAVSVQEMRRQLAMRHRVDATCPVSTAIFLRIVAEHAHEAHLAGAPIESITPFWRVVEPGSPLLKKLSFDSAWVMAQRANEGLPV